MNKKVDFLFISSIGYARRLKIPQHLSIPMQLCLHLASPPPSPHVLSTTTTRPAIATKPAPISTALRPAGLSSSPSTHQKARQQKTNSGSSWTPPSVKHTKSSRDLTRSAGLSSREHAIASSPLKQFGPRRGSKIAAGGSNRNLTKNNNNHTVNALSHQGTAHILNTNSPQKTSDQQRKELQRTRLCGGTNSTRTMAERNLTTSASFRSLHAPKQQPPWTKEQMREYLADAANGTNMGNATNRGNESSRSKQSATSSLDQKIQQIETEVNALDRRRPNTIDTSFSPKATGTAGYSTVSDDGALDDPETTPHMQYNYQQEEQAQHRHMTPAQHVDAIKHHLNSRIRHRHEHISQSTVAECSFVESLPASRSVVHHPEYTRLTKAAYRFELDAQVRAHRARDEIERVRTAKLAARVQQHQHNLSLARETKENIVKEKQKRSVIASLDKQILQLQQKKAAIHRQKEHENHDLRYLRNALEGATTRAEKLVEAHHDSNHHLHLLKWQKLHRALDQRKSSSKKSSKGKNKRR